MVKITFEGDNLKASDLVKKLNELINEHGDLELYYRSNDIHNEIEVEITNVGFRKFEILEGDFEIT